MLRNTHGQSGKLRVGVYASLSGFVSSWVRKINVQHCSYMNDFGAVPRRLKMHLLILRRFKTAPSGLGRFVLTASLSSF